MEEVAEVGALVIERRFNWSEGVHRRVAKWLIGLPCHKINVLPLA